MRADIDAGVAMCRERCEYFSVCGGGEPVNKLAENGGFASTETAYCRLTKMRATDLVLDALDRVPVDGFDPATIGRWVMPDGESGPAESAGIGR